MGSTRKKIRNSGSAEASRPTTRSLVEHDIDVERNQRRWQTTREIAIVAATLIITFLYLFERSDKAYIPHDDGTLAHTAERVFVGEVPHVDFDDPYTGGLTYLHALSFYLFGTRYFSTRIVLLAFSLLCALTVFRISRRTTGPWVAALITLLSVAWTVPNYFAGMPSWYNMFFAVFGCWGLIRYEETTAKRWLVFTGITTGASCLAKISGLYFAAAVLLHFAYREVTAPKRESNIANRFMFRLVLTLCALFFAWLLFKLIEKNTGSMEILHFLVPGLCLCLLPVILAFCEPNTDSGLSLYRAASEIALFAGGIAIPVAIFLIPFVQRGEVAPLLNGVFVLPFKRTEWSTFALPEVSTLISAFPWCILLLCAKRRITSRWSIVAVFVTALGAAFYLGLVQLHPQYYRFAWYSLRPLIPILVVYGCFQLLHPTKLECDLLHRRITFLLLAVTGLTSLIQHPFSHPLYLCYTAVFPILTLVFVLKLIGSRWKPIWLAVGAGLMAFALLFSNRSALGTGEMFLPNTNIARCELSRHHLEINSELRNFEMSIIECIRKHSAPEDAILAFPDCPHIYFLSNRRNPGRRLFDFFDDSYRPDDPQYVAGILEQIDSKNIKVVVLNWTAEFSLPPSALMYHQITERFQFINFIAPLPGEDRVRLLTTIAWRD